MLSDLESAVGLRVKCRWCVVDFVVDVNPLCIVGIAALCVEMGKDAAK